MLTSTTSTAEDFTTLMEDVLVGRRSGFPPLLDRFHRDTPDVVCSGTTDPLGRLLSDVLAVPPSGSSRTSPATARPMSETSMPESFGFRHPRSVAVGRARDEFAAEHGIDHFPEPMSEVVAPLNLVFVPGRFPPGGEVFDDRSRFVGPAPHPPAGADWQPRPAGTAAAHLLGHGATDRPEFLRTCLEGFADGRWQVAMAVGEHLREDDLGEVVANIGIRPSFPQLAVLDLVNAFVTRAGRNSTRGSLFFEVPLVVVPQVLEQHANAAGAEELGLGAMLPLDGLTSTALRTAVEEVAASPRTRADLAEMRQDIDSGGGAVAVLESELVR